MVKEQNLQREQQKIDHDAGLSKIQKNINREREQCMRRENKRKGYFNIKSNNNWHQHVQREASVQIADDWNVVEEIDFIRFKKLSLMPTEEPQDLLVCGCLSYFDKSNDRTSVHKTQKLQFTSKGIPSTGTMDDPHIRTMAQQKAGNVFATDNLLAYLMCCPRSVRSWDIIAQRVGDILFLDKRRNSDHMEFESVYETAEKPPSDDVNSINSAQNLSLEATLINRNFVQQVLSQVI